MSQSTNLNIRISEELRKMIGKAAEKSGLHNESEWIRRKLEVAAKRELAK